MDEHVDEDGQTLDRVPGEHPGRPQWLNGPIQPSPVDTPTGAPPGLPLSQTSPRPPPPFDRSPDAAVPEQKSGWLKPALVGGVVGAVVAAAMAGGIVAASDDSDIGSSPAPTAVASRPSTRLADGGLSVGEVLDAVEKGVVSIKVQGIQRGGQRLVYVGEPPGGRTARWRLLTQVPLPCWADRDDRLFVFGPPPAEAGAGRWAERFRRRRRAA